MVDKGKERSRDELRHAVRSAAQWYVLLQSPTISVEQQQAWQNWLAQAESHQIAWQQLQQLQSSVTQLPRDIALPVLRGVVLSRRELLQRLGMAAVLAPLGALALKQVPWQQWQAQYATATGQQGRYILNDGGQLTLNTASAADVVFNADSRLVRLYKGEVLIQTAPDLQQASRPFFVATPHGRIQALGTRFIVRIDGRQSRVTVLEKAVRIYPASGAPGQELEQGQQLSFTANHISTATSADPSADDWLNGYLSVVDMPLRQLLNELSRYRPGLLNCSDDVAELKISGAFPLADTDRAIAAITQAFPIKERRFNTYWVRLSAS